MVDLAAAARRLYRTINPARPSWLWHYMAMPADGPIAGVVVLARYRYATRNHAAAEGATVPPLRRDA